MGGCEYVEDINASQLQVMHSKGVRVNGFRFHTLNASDSRIELRIRTLDHPYSQGLAGGDHLKKEILPTEKPSKRAISKLRDALLTPRTGLPLLVLIAQQRQVGMVRNFTRVST